MDSTRGLEEEGSLVFVPRADADWDPHTSYHQNATFHSKKMSESTKALRYRADAFESIGYSKDVDAWLSRCWRMLKPGGRLPIRSPGSLDFCRREKDFLSVTAFFENWRYNFLRANVLVLKLRRLGCDPIRYRHLPFWAWGLTWNFFQHLYLWKFKLRMRTMVDLEKIIWRTSKLFVS
jgi:hypothetical protein